MMNEHAPELGKTFMQPSSDLSLPVLYPYESSGDPRQNVHESSCTATASSTTTTTTSPQHHFQQRMSSNDQLLGSNQSIGTDYQPALSQCMTNFPQCIQDPELRMAPTISLNDQLKLAQKELEESKESKIKSLEQLKFALHNLEEAKKLYAQAQLQVQEANKRFQKADDHLAELELSLSGQWNDMYKQFVAYRNRYGHCNVSQDSVSTRTKIEDLQTKEEQDRKSLARWVGNQRVEYKKYQCGQNSCLNQRRIDALNRLGFIWDLQGAKWYLKYNELVEFQKENGHCRVPKSYNPELSKWVTSQRYAWRRKKYGKGPPHLTDEREALLMKIAFNFEDESIVM